tara:strand:+ start:57 stop:470 length:414 start_codon:yes stop_codon:yes gene_type:complete
MKKVFFVLFFQLLSIPSIAEILIFQNCKSNDYIYEKNDYVLDLEKGLMTREFIYSDESYKKLRLNDISIKKNNTTNKRIAEENDLYVSEISGYPAFYTQLIFNKRKANVKIRTVLNNTEGESLLSECETVINYKKES